jgi:multidrug transporter EmrE-like cation transporter
MAPETEHSITGLVRGVLDDARELIREEVALAKAEARVEISKATAAAAQFGAAAVAGWFALMFILCAVALGISAGLQWPVWTGFGIVGAVLAVAAAVMFFTARAAARRVEPMPRTIESVKENFR